MNQFIVYDQNSGQILKTITISPMSKAQSVDPKTGQTFIQQCMSANVPSGATSMAVDSSFNVWANPGSMKVQNGQIVTKTLIDILVTSIANVLTITLTPAAPGVILVVQPGNLIPGLNGSGSGAVVTLSTGIQGKVYIDPNDPNYYSAQIGYST